jgi:hypothetical protein
MELRDLVLRYARGIDRKEPERIASVFTEDATLNGDSDGANTGGMAIANGILDYHADEREFEETMHFVGNQTFDIDEESATGETYCVALHWYTQDGDRMEHGMYIRYEDAFCRESGEWLIEQRDLTIDEDYIQVLPQE